MCAALNRDLWTELDKQLASHTIQWLWVSGLAEEAYNTLRLWQTERLGKRFHPRAIS